MIVTISSSDLAEKDLISADEEGKPDPSDEECPAVPKPVSVVTQWVNLTDRRKSCQNIGAALASSY